jgi:hypothetical protein
VKFENVMGGFLRGVGKVVGIGAGLVMAGWDFIRGGQEIGEGNIGVGALYLGSAVGAAVAILAFSKLGAAFFGAAATGVGIVLVVLVIIIAVWIEIWKDNKIQDWLERCYYGKLYPAYYNNNPALEMEELGVALRG